MSSNDSKRISLNKILEKARLGELFYLHRWIFNNLLVKELFLSILQIEAELKYKRDIAKSYEQSRNNEIHIVTAGILLAMSL